MFILARESRGLTQVQLKDKMKVSQAVISRVEQGFLKASDDLIKNFSDNLQYPESFFFEPGYRYPPATPFHRKKKALPKRIQSMIEAKANIRRGHITKLLNAVEFIDTKVRHLDLCEYNDDPSEIARAIRRAWMLPRGPIENVTKTLENSGIIVVFWDFGTPLLDGFTLLTDNAPPIIYINSDMSGDRIRFTLSHELGHVTMHSTPTSTMEDEADLFASEFLMPSDEIGPYLNHTPVNQINLNRLASLKLYWKASMAALLKKASHLKKITYNQERYLWSQMAKYGYLKREPVQFDLSVEYPSLLQEILDLYSNELSYSNYELSELMALHEEEFSELYLPHTQKLRVVK